MGRYLFYLSICPLHHVQSRYLYDDVDLYQNHLNLYVLHLDIYHYENQIDYVLHCHDYDCALDFD